MLRTFVKTNCDVLELGSTCVIVTDDCASGSLYNSSDAGTSPRPAPQRATSIAAASKH